MLKNLTFAIPTHLQFLRVVVLGWLKDLGKLILFSPHLFWILLSLSNLILRCRQCSILQNAIHFEPVNWVISTTSPLFSNGLIFTPEELGLISCNATRSDFYSEEIGINFLQCRRFQGFCSVVSKNQIYLESLSGRKPQQRCISDEKTCIS